MNSSYNLFITKTTLMLSVVLNFEPFSYVLASQRDQDMPDLNLSVEQKKPLKRKRSEIKPKEKNSILDEENKAEKKARKEDISSQSVLQDKCKALSDPIDYFSKLPEQLTVLILSHLSPHDLGNVSLVSRKMKIFTEDDYVWSSISIEQGISEHLAGRSMNRQFKLQVYTQSILLNSLLPFLPTQEQVNRNFSKIERNIEADVFGNFDLFPEEIITLILSYLGPRGLANVSLVSRRMKGLAEDDSLWLPFSMRKGLHVARELGPVKPQVQHKVMDIKKRIHKLEIKNKECKKKLEKTHCKKIRAKRKIKKSRKLNSTTRKVRKAKREMLELRERYLHLKVHEARKRLKKTQRKLEKVRQQYLKLRTLN